jgi:hypothetical protein
VRPLYCDGSIWVPVADGLRRRGWTVYTARDEGRLGDPDREHPSYAIETDRISVTFDDDFLSLVEDAGFEHAGIVYVQQAGRDIGDVVRAVDANLDSRSGDDRGIHYC